MSCRRSTELKREDVIRLCHEQAVPIYHGKIDKSLFSAVREELALRPVTARGAPRQRIFTSVKAPRLILLACVILLAAPPAAGGERALERRRRDGGALAVRG